MSYWSLQENDAVIVCERLHLRDRQQEDENFKGTQVRAADCPSYFEALATKRPIVANDVLVHPATGGLVDSYLRPLGITSMLDAPVWVRGEVVGVLCHEHTGPVRAWSAEEIDFVSALATMVSLALEESQRARSEHLLRESEEKFRALFEASSQGVILHDEEKILEMNPASLRILGFQRADEMIGRHLADTSVPIHANGESALVLARRHIQDCIVRGSTRFEWLARNSGGEEIPVEVFLTRIQWGGRQLIQAVFNDIAAGKKTEAELLKTLAREKELGQLRSRFVSMVSHEFQTPLGIIQSSAEILEDYLDRLEPVERKDHLRSIRKNTRRMAGLMEEVLLIGSIDAGKVEFKPALMDLQSFMRWLVDEVLSATNQRCPIELFLAEMRRNLTTILRLEKFQPLAAENGKTGVELARREKPDLILCDVMMPELDGYGVLAALRADAATVSIPFIFLTAKGEKPEVRAGMNLGADDYLVKPVAKADLLGAILSRLERAAHQTALEVKPSGSPAARGKTAPPRG